MQIDGQNPVNADAGNHVGYHFGADGHAGGANATILAGVAIIGDYRCNTGG